jgi:hypothetical protein
VNRPVSLQNLQIGLAVQRSDSMPHPRYCSLKIYDLTATSDSFSCYYIEVRMDERNNQITAFD